MRINFRLEFILPVLINPGNLKPGEKRGIRNFILSHLMFPNMLGITSGKRMLFVLILFSLLLHNSLFSQELRKSLFSVTGGYVVGNNSSYENNSSQYLIWGDYYFSTLDEISAVYKRFSLNENTFDYNENFFAVKGLMNFFPFYIRSAFAHLSGKYNNANLSYNISGNMISGEGIYYYKLFFTSLGGKYISFNGYGNSEKLAVGFGDIKWRPMQSFAVTLGTQIMKSLISDSLYKSVNIEFFWSPVKFANFSVMGFTGERKYNFDRNYLISYNLPDKETGAYSAYVRVFPVRQIGLILNYEKHFYNAFSVEYYSLSVKFNLL